MTKNELIQYLRQYSSADSECREAKYRIDIGNIDLYGLGKEPNVKYHSLDDPLDTSVSNMIVLMIIITVACSIITIPLVFIISWILKLNIADTLFSLTSWDFWINHPIWTRILLAALISAIFSYPLAKSIEKSVRSEDVKKLEKYQEELEEIAELKSEIKRDTSIYQAAQARMQRLASQGVVHSKYLNYSSVLLNFLETGRADTLKEAINLLEIQFRENSRDAERRAYYQAMQNQAYAQAEALSEIYSETNRAASAAQSAAAWSAAGTLLTAAEIERQKKRERE